MTQPKKYLLRKFTLDEVSFTPAGGYANPHSRIVFAKSQITPEELAKVAAHLHAKAGPAPKAEPVTPAPAADPIAKRAADALAELTTAIAKARDILDGNADVLKAADFATMSAADKAIASLATQIGKANQQLRKAHQRREADALFSKAGLSNSLADLQAEVAKAEALPAQFQAHVDQTDLDTLRMAKAKADRPAHPVDRHRRRVDDALDDEVSARQARTSEPYLEALDAILAARRRNRGG